MQSAIAEVRRLCEPIAEGAPAGNDLSFDPEFEAVAEEIARLERVDGPRTDWRVVASRSDALLAQRTKDMRLLVWGVAARVHNTGWSGLAHGLSVYVEMVRRYWTDMFPPARRVRGRVSLHEWLVEHVAPLLEERPVDDADREALNTASTANEELEVLFTQHFGDANPGCARFRTIFRRKLQDLPPLPEASADIAREGEAATSVDNPSEARISGEAQETPARAKASHAPIARTAAGLLSTSAALLAADPSDALAYRARRLAFSLSDVALSTAPSDRERLRERMRACAWSDLLREAEAALVAVPAWLDAHWYVAESMARLGVRYWIARGVVEAEAFSLVVRQPALLSSIFPDGTPVATAQTVAWIQEGLRRIAGANALISAEDREVERRRSEVDQMASEGRTHEAVALAIALANRAGDARGRFRGSLLACKIAVSAGQFAVARPFLESLLALAAHHNLEAWDPGLCVDLYSLVVSCLRQVVGSESESQARDIFDKLCKLDPSAAMRVAPPVVE